MQYKFIRIMDADPNQDLNKKLHEHNILKKCFKHIKKKINLKAQNCATNTVKDNFASETVTCTR